MKLILLLVACCGTALQTTSACADGDLEKLVDIYAVSSQSCRDRGWIDVDWFRVAEPGSRLYR